MRSHEPNIWLVRVTCLILLYELLFAVPACGAGLRSVGPGGGPDRAPPGLATRWVGSFRLTGNATFASSAITAKLHYRPPDDDSRKRQVYDPATLELDKQRIVAFYRDRGYFATSAVARVSRKAASLVDIEIAIVEGPPTTIISTLISGWPAATRVGPYDVLDAAVVQRDAVFVHENYLVAKRELAAELEKAGYIHADVAGQVRIDEKRHTAEIAFAITSGPRVRFGKTIVRGNQRVPESAIRARVAWREGDVFSLDKLHKTRNALFELGLFSAVGIDYGKSEAPRPDDSPGILDVTIEVSEGKRHALTLGGGLGFEGIGSSLGLTLVDEVDTRIDIRGRAELTVYSWLDPLITLRTGIRPGYVVLPGTSEERSFVFDARAEITRQDLFLPRLTASAFAAYVVDRFDSYSTNGPRAGVSLDRLLWAERLRLGLGVQGELATIAPASAIDLAALGTSSPLGVVTLFQSVIVDRRDDRLSPSLGWYAAERLEQGRSFADGQGLYFESLSELRGYLPLVDRVVLAGRSRAGFLLVEKGQRSPLTERFFSGGSVTHRGFALRHLAPVVANASGATVPVGGDALLEASVDLRIRVKKWAHSALGFALFVDAGDVTSSPSQLDLGNLHIALGVGLRYHSVLPIRFDFAYRINRRVACTTLVCRDPDPDKPLIFHFSVGEAF